MNTQSTTPLEGEGPWSPGWKRRAATTLLGEGSARRLASGVDDMRAWSTNTVTRKGRANADYLRQFKNAHFGERCVIIGNGPSLKKTDMNLLREETTFGLNRIYLMFDQLGFETNYHVTVNQLVVEQCADELRALRSPLFTTWPNYRHLAGRAQTGYLNKITGPRFSTDAAHGIWEGATVTYVAMQLAHFMGFSKVVLVGVDHRFAVSGPAHRVVESTGPDHSHFDANYFGRGFRWQLPDLETSEVAYHLAREAFEKDGRSILDATVDGELAVFPKMSLAEALGR